jgi:hypothetical protein
VERTTIAGETEVFGENLPQRHFVPPQIPQEQVRFRTPDRSTVHLLGSEMLEDDKINI